MLQMQKAFKLWRSQKLLDGCSVNLLQFTVTTALKAWKSRAVKKDCMKLHKQFVKQVHVRQWMKLSASHRSSVRLQIAVHRKWLKFHKKSAPVTVETFYWENPITKLVSPVNESSCIAVCSFERGFPADENTYLAVSSKERGFPADESTYLAVCSLERGFPVDESTYLSIYVLALVPRKTWRLKKFFCCSFFTNHAMS